MISQDQVEQAKAVPIERIVAHLRLKRRGKELSGPCPKCGGADRFAVNTAKGVFLCRQCDPKGGDVIALYQFVHDCDFKEAVEQLNQINGTPVPKRNGDDRPERVPMSKTNGHDHSEREPRFIAGDILPPQPNELRRHTYQRDGASVKAKIKQSKGIPWINWYRVEGGWQDKRPNGYIDAPYFKLGFNPFYNREGFLLWPEGEKDTETVADMGFRAFAFGGTGDGLSSSVKDVLPRYLAGEDIVILADNDEPGEKHAQAKAAFAHQHGAASVRIIKFGQHKDVSDWRQFLTDSGEDPDRIVGMLEHAIEGTPLWQPGNGILQAPDGGLREPPPSSKKQNGAPQPGWRDVGAHLKEIRIMKFDPVRFLVQGLIPSEGVTLLCSKPKKGKSWMLLDLALAATMNRYTLGDRKPTQGDVLLLSLEDNYRRIKERSEKLLQGDRNVEWPEGLRIQPQWRRLDQGGGDDIREWVNETRAAGRTVAFVAVDTLAYVKKPGDPKKPYEGDVASMRMFKDLATELGIAIIIAHHLRKQGSDDVGDLVSGTLGLSGTADTLLIIDARSSGTVLCVRGRDVEENEFSVEFNKSTCKWTILGKAEDVARTEIQDKILGALRERNGGPMTPLEITEITGLKKNTAGVTLVRMAKAQQIHSPARGQYALLDA
jgi:hypothetical protein